MNVTAPDFNIAPPQSGREKLGGYAWLARLADKVRADHAATAADYIAYCGLSTGFLERSGVSVDEFDELIRGGASDAELTSYFNEHVSGAQREATNSYVLNDMKSHLDDQDAEEGR